MLKSIFDKIRQNHLLAMVLCCAIPLAAILVLSSLEILGEWGYYALILLCPLGHIVMMRGMVHGTAKTEKLRIEQGADQN